MYLVHFRQAPLTFLICCDMVGVLHGKMTPVLRPGVILQKGQAPLDAPMMLGASLLASKGKRQNAKASRVMAQGSASFNVDAKIFKVRP